MQPEGIAGVLHGGRPDREAVYLKQRKGFVRLAIRAGTGALPLEIYGHTLPCTAQPEMGSKAEGIWQVCHRAQCMCTSGHLPKQRMQAVVAGLSCLLCPDQQAPEQPDTRSCD